MTPRLSQGMVCIVLFVLAVIDVILMSLLMTWHLLFIGIDKTTVEFMYQEEGEEDEVAQQRSGWARLQL